MTKQTLASIVAFLFLVAFLLGYILHDKINPPQKPESIVLVQHDTTVAVQFDTTVVTKTHWVKVPQLFENLDKPDSLPCPVETVRVKTSKPAVFKYRDKLVDHPVPYPTPLTPIRPFLGGGFLWNLAGETRWNIEGGVTVQTPRIQLDLIGTYRPGKDDKFFGIGIQSRFYFNR